MAYGYGRAKNLKMVDVDSLSKIRKWASQLATFDHNKPGPNVELSQNCSVATTVKGAYNRGIVVTREPVSVGQMLKVIVSKTNKEWSGGLVSFSSS